MFTVNTNTRLGWIGTGIMGLPICRSLLRAGFPLSVTTRTRAKAEPLLAAGATWADSPRELAQQVDLLMTMVGFPHELREVYFSERGIFAATPLPKVLVDLSTSQPALAVEIAAAAAQRGSQALDAPVSGGEVGAQQARLSLMVGGDEATFKSLLPIWQAIGQTYVFQGPPGSGQQTKLVNQILVAASMIGVCEALLMAYRAGLDLDRVLQSVSSGAAGSWSLTNLAPRIRDNDFAPGFLVEHFIKDLKLALDEAQRLQLTLPGLALVHQLYVVLAEQGGSRRGTQALQLALARLSGIDWTARTGSPGSA